MGDDIYIAYWRSVLPNLLLPFEQGKSISTLVVSQLKNFGKRASYYANFVIRKGELEISKNAYAHGRDLFYVLKENDYFKNHLSSSLLDVNISKDFVITIKIIEEVMDFFVPTDFEYLVKYAGVKKDSDNLEHQQAYDYLKNTYSKTYFWANEVQKALFPNGVVKMVQKPTNQANNFERYH
ncbi:MAG: hypothetical protein KDC92_08635, partial [Bacteroidetes bacterium]|nr:hypothetical protein [Bacteroidota bacterium]